MCAVGLPEINYFKIFAIHCVMGEAGGCCVGVVFILYFVAAVRMNCECVGLFSMLMFTFANFSKSICVHARGI